MRCDFLIVVFLGSPVTGVDPAGKKIFLKKAWISFSRSCRDNNLLILSFKSLRWQGAVLVTVLLSLRLITDLSQSLGTVMMLFYYRSESDLLGQIWVYRTDSESDLWVGSLEGHVEDLRSFSIHDIWIGVVFCAHGFILCPETISAWFRMKDLPHNHVGILIYGYVLTSSERQPGFEGKIPGNVFTRVTKSPQGHVHQRKFL